MMEVANDTLTTGTNEQLSPLTRRLYDAIAPVYALPTLLFHSKAHAAALEAASIENESRILEVAIGSGEMLRRLVQANPNGQTIGVDLSPKMAARSQETAGQEFPGAAVHCQAADARYLPFPTGYFDAVVCCYLFELIPQSDVPDALAEIHRVLRPGGRLTTILVAQNDRNFNAMYRACSSIVPAFWGRQLDGYVIDLLSRYGFATESDNHIKQFFYSSRIVSVTRGARSFSAAAG